MPNPEFMFNASITKFVIVPAFITVILLSMLYSSYTNTTDADKSANIDKNATSSIFTPHWDPEIVGGWILNPALSDEFEGEGLDTNK